MLISKFHGFISNRVHHKASMKIIILDVQRGITKYPENFVLKYFNEIDITFYGTSPELDAIHPDCLYRISSLWSEKAGLIVSNK